MKWRRKPIWSRLAVAGAAVVVAACVPPPAPGNQPRISVQAVCYEVRSWQGVSYNLIFWQWSTVDGPARVQVQDVTNHLVTAVVDLPGGGGTYWAKFAQSADGNIVWMHDGTSTQVATFPANYPLPARCTWLVPPI